ncbi:nucleotide-binding universal stress UspA family protein [Methanolinea mesophila]|uniref:universal stress protein n=1 Tax=Methanolinea mesophila TaxID=547055 RepID=UPI001AE78D9E|nr:universal stress protein [Methanolinea mesophila]MBP1928741.1 nucleotide-binding universal stress UspA family protein [Methanolinea mesophila]
MKILVLLDGSTWSQKCAIHALQVAKNRGAEVTFFSVLDRNEARALAFNFCAQSELCSQIKDYEEQIWRDMRRNINSEMNDLSIHCAREDVKCRSMVVEGPVQDEVIREANSGGYFLVVMGAYGKSGKSHCGSLSELVAGKITPPLLIVK